MNKIIKILFIVLVLTGLSAGLTPGCSDTFDGSQYGSPDTAPKIGKYAPDFVLLDITGKETYLSDLRGKPVLINFWASWCGPCIDEMPLFQEIQETWADKGLVILAVNSGEGTGQVKRFIETRGYTFPVLLDGKQAVTSQYNVRGFPATFFIGPDGKIEDIRVGGFTRKAQIEASLKKIMP